MNLTIWDLAQRLRKRTLFSIRYRLPLLFHGLADGIFDYSAWLKAGHIDYGQVGGAGECVNISNVGRYPYPIETPPFRLRNIYGLNGACLSGPMLLILTHSR